MEAQNNVRQSLTGPRHVDSTGSLGPARRGGHGHGRGDELSPSEAQAHAQDRRDSLDLEAGVVRPMQRQGLQIEQPRDEARPERSSCCPRWPARQVGRLAHCYKRHCAPDSCAVHLIRYVPIVAGCVTAAGLWFSYQNWTTLESARASSLIAALRPQLLQAHQQILGALASLQGAVIGFGGNITSPLNVTTAAPP